MLHQRPCIIMTLISDSGPLENLLARPSSLQSMSHPPTRRHETYTYITYVLLKGISIYGPTHSFDCSFFNIVKLQACNDKHCSHCYIVCHARQIRLYGHSSNVLHSLCGLSIPLDGAHILLNFLRHRFENNRHDGGCSPLCILRCSLQVAT